MTKKAMTLRNAIGITLKRTVGDEPSGTTKKYLDPWLEEHNIPTEYRSYIRWVLESEYTPYVFSAWERGDSVRNIIKIARFGEVRGRAAKVSKEHAYRADNSPDIAPKTKARAISVEEAVANYEREREKLEARLRELEDDIRKLTRMDDETASNHCCVVISKLVKGGWTLAEIKNVFTLSLSFYDSEDEV